MTTNRRKRQRRPLTYPAHLISLDGSGRRFDCTFADVSETGARLVVENSESVPDAVLLLLAGGRGPHRACEVVWRADELLGVRFVPPAQDNKKKITVKARA